MRLRFGPGALVAAAFVGPGTVTTATLAGAQFGTALLWALVFATVATIILQDMSVRLGVVGQRGLGEALLEVFDSRPLRVGVSVLVLAGLAVGNAAYEAGNLAGGAMGVVAIAGDSVDQSVAVALLAALALAAVALGSYRRLEVFLIALVLMMSAAFLLSTLLVWPDPMLLLGGLVPTIPDGATLLAAALIGTTIVPYNLFLHAAAARRRWSDEQDLADARAENLTSVALGGVVSILILVTAATGLYGSGMTVAHAGDMARALEPVFGETARYLIGFGLFGAGFTSAVTAPLAAGWVAAELWPSEERPEWVSRTVAAAIVLIGAFNALVGVRPVQLIVVAQFANALLLPLIAVFLLYVMNQARLLGNARNGLVMNLAGSAVVVVCLGLGLRALVRLIGG